MFKTILVNCSSNLLKLFKLKELNKCCRPMAYCTMNSVKKNCLNTKYQRFNTTECKDILIRRLECVASIYSLFAVRRKCLKYL